MRQLFTFAALNLSFLYNLKHVKKCIAIVTYCRDIYDRKVRFDLVRFEYHPRRGVHVGTVKFSTHLCVVFFFRE